MSIARDKARNTELVNAADMAVFRLRFEGVAIPQDVWKAASDLLVALDGWRNAKSKASPETPKEESK